MIKKFLEYVNTNKGYIPIDFNDNEIKYMSNKGCLKKISGSYVLNMKIIHKLTNHDYLVTEDDITCSTIQTLVKYTQDFIKDLSDWIDNIINNIIIKDSSNPYIKEWYYNDKVWAKQNIGKHLFYINIEGWNHILKYVENTHFITDKIKAFLDYKLLHLLDNNGYKYGSL